MPLVVIFSNKPSPLNKKLVKFFQINLINLNKASLIFNFEVADPKDINKYISKGVKNYPVLIDNDKKITGTITFKKIGPKTSAIGALNGLPNPFTNPTSGLPVQNNTGSLTYKSEEDSIKDSERSILVERTISSLTSMIENEYGVTVKLIATAK